MGPVLSIAIFLVAGMAFVLFNLVVGSLLRPSMPGEEKQAIYECGEPTIGESWVQFDLRFYIVALFYLVFDVEVALIYPWAVVFRQFPFEALVLGSPFLAFVVIGYAYEWYCGSLDWVRSSEATTGGAGVVSGGGPTRPSAGRVDLAKLARRDPEVLEDQGTAV